MGNRALPARRKTVGGKWVLDFNSSHKIHCKLDIAIPCRSCNQTRSGSTYVDFWSAINLHASLSIHEMLGIGIVWFVQTLFSFFFIWVASSLDPGQRCDAGLDRDCSVCWLHKWFQGLHVCISPITAVHPTPISPPPVFVCYSCCYLHFKIRRSPYHCCHCTLNQPGLFRFCVFDVDMKVYTSDEKCGVKESKSA